MVRSVVVTGANGYIGASVCRAFRRDGWTVYGIVRSADSALTARLPHDEIITVVADTSRPSTYVDIIKKSAVVVDCATVNASADLALAIVAVMNAAGALNGKKRLFVWTTGFAQYAFEEGVLAK